MADSSGSTLDAKDQVGVASRNISAIKNKKKRLEEYIKLKKEKNKIKKIARKKRQNEAKILGDKAPAKQIPRTLENTREVDVTMVEPEDEEVHLDLNVDEMSSYFRKETIPKILISSTENPHTRTIKFCSDLRMIIPNSEFKGRKKASIKKTVKQAIAKEYTDIIIVNEDKRNPNALLLIHLPEGPTAYFRVSNFKPSNKVKNRAAMSNHRPEVILNNFNTRLGHSVGRMLASIFHYDPEFVGRRVVTFHNQRDYIFFRHHRYEFKNEKRAGLQEIGPEFTLRLKSLQKGTFDSKFGEFEWVLKRHEMETSRRRFFL